MRTKILLALVLVLTLLGTTVVSAGAPVHQVSAGGKWEFEGGIDETYGFVTQVDRDGVASGQGEFHVQGQLMIHFEVNCLSVDGNTAWLGGVVTRSNDLVNIPVGLDFTWQLQDNGEGKNAAPDLQSFVIPTFELTLLGLGTNCKDQGDLFALAEFEWHNGNFQIR